MEFRQPVLVHKDLEHSEKEVAEGLVKLRRMLWFGLTTKFEDESPWKVCNVSIELGIEEVTQADECRCEADCNRKVVKNPDEIKSYFLP